MHTRYNCFIFNSIIACPESIPNSIFNLTKGVLVWTLHQNRDGLRILTLLNESVLILAQDVLVNKASETQLRFLNVVQMIQGDTAAGERQALHVAALRPAQRHDTFLGEHIQTHRVDTFLIDDDEILAVVVAELLLQFDHLLHALLDELALGGDELLPLLGSFVEEARVDFALLVFHADVAGQYVGVGELLGHIRMPASMIQN